MKVDVVATIGAKKNCYEDIEKIINKGITHLRFNFSKFKKNYDKRVELIQRIKENFGNDVTIMIDIPFPGDKIRIYHTRDYFDVKCGESLWVKSYDSLESCAEYSVDFSEFVKYVKEGMSIIYSDGEAEFRVDKVIDDNVVKLRAENDFVFRSGKALNLGHIKRAESLDKRFVDLIKGIKPDELALSFIDDPKYVLQVENELKQYGVSTRILSKIENQKGIDNIDEISKVSDIIIGRGDLCLNTDYHRLYYNQKLISQQSKKNNGRVYVATQILTSLMTNAVPSQPDIIDLSVIAKLNVTGIVINSGVIFANVDKVVHTINCI